MSERYDYVIVGSGIGGLFTGALLAAAGRRVCLLERHYAVGGYGHSFRRKGYLFCAELHYIFNCLAGQDVEVFFHRLGLDHEVTFSPLDPNGFDQIHFPGVTYHIRAGFDRNLETLSEQFPRHRPGLVKYFNLLNTLCDELYELPLGFSVSDVLRHPWRHRHVIAYRGWTLQRLFDSCRCR
ncbi:MAG: NAD(P)-binding protein [Planctomycetes bacterium]|nr:NAD(P)-binding protein [Planctomycetota bacterium]